MNGFSDNLFAILVYYIEVGDVGFGMFVANTVLVNCTGDMAIVLCWTLLCREVNNFLLDSTIYRQCFGLVVIASYCLISVYLQMCI